MNEQIGFNPTAFDQANELLQQGMMGLFNTELSRRYLDSNKANIPKVTRKPILPRPPLNPQGIQNSYITQSRESELKKELDLLRNVEPKALKDQDTYEPIDNKIEEEIQLMEKLKVETEKARMERDKIQNELAQLKHIYQHANSQSSSKKPEYSEYGIQHF